MDTIGIKIISVVNEDNVTKKGEPYTALVITYKNLTFDKVEQKKVMPFGESRNVKDALEGAAVDSEWTITRVKNGQYWNWTEASAGVSGNSKGGSMGSNNSSPVPSKANYTRDFESREERARRQVLIVRQSSLSAAVATLSTNAKSALKPDDVIALAEKYNEYVFGAENVDVATPTSDAA